MKQRVSEPRLDLSTRVFWIVVFCFVGWIHACKTYKAYELSHTGQSTLASVRSCERVEAIGTRGGILHLVDCQVAYDGHVGHMGSSAYDAGPGQQFPVLYLPSDPSVVLAGDAGDSAWRILVKNHGWFDSLFGIVLCLALFVGLLSLILLAVLGKSRWASFLVPTMAIFPVGAAIFVLGKTGHPSGEPGLGAAISELGKPERLSSGSGFGSATGRVRVGGLAQSARLMEQPLPVYPPLARQARIQGTVRLEVLVGKQGSIEELKVVSGHPLLIPAARDAVRQWRYQPTLLDGQPVEVVTTIDVNFKLEPESEEVARSDGPVFRVGGEVSAPQVLYKAEPEYTEQARQAKYQGTVVLSLVVQHDGSVRDIQVVQPLGMGLDERAIAAVKKWRFRPGMRRGAPVDVAAVIEVTFRLL